LIEQGTAVLWNGGDAVTMADEIGGSRVFIHCGGGLMFSFRADVYTCICFADKMLINNSNWQSLTRKRRRYTVAEDIFYVLN